MSLINEALKRTRDAGYQSAQTSPPATAEYRLESVAKAHGAKPVFLVMGVIGCAILAGGIVLAVWVVPRIRSVTDSLVPDKESSITEAKSSTPSIQPTPMGETSPKAEVASPATPQPAVATPPADAKGSEDQIVAKVMERIKAEQPAAPQLVLQGITYASDNRDAMINGVTVHEGEVIEGARVVTIDDRRVTLDLNGHEMILRLP